MLISYVESDKEKLKVEAKIKKMRNPRNCFSSNNNNGDRLDEYLASREKMNEVSMKNNLFLYFALNKVPFKG